MVTYVLDICTRYTYGITASYNYYSISSIFLLITRRFRRCEVSSWLSPETMPPNIAPDGSPITAFSDRAAVGRLVLKERAAAIAHNASARAALIVYHDVHTSSSTGASNPLPAWARSAQRISLALSAVLRTVLYTNLANDQLDGAFSRVVHADLLKLSGMQDVAPRAMCGLKIAALLHGWREAVLPEEVLMLDADIAVLQPRPLLRMFAPLAFYDVAAVMEGYSRGWDGKDTAVRDDSLATAPDPAWFGWEVNTGVIALHRRAAWFVRLWAAEFRAGLPLYSKLTGAYLPCSSSRRPPPTGGRQTRSGLPVIAAYVMFEASAVPRPLRDSFHP